jgi:hypothetical protein
MQWQPRYEGLVIEVPLGWTELPSHMPDDEVWPLLELLARSSREPVELLSLDWDDLDARVPRVHERMIVAIRVPAAVDVAALERRLGCCRGLWLRDAGGHWPSPFWHEREVKAPLVLWLLADLRRPDHPAAAWQIAELPVELLGGLTSEPIEFVQLVEYTIAHRLTFDELGTDAGAWLRSAKWAVAQRLARRWSDCAPELIAKLVELLLLGVAAIRRVGVEAECEALVELGLAHAGDDDIALTALARAFAELELLGPLIAIQPELPWGPRACAAMAAMLPRELVPLRAAVSAPDFPWTSRPLVFVNQPLHAWGQRLGTAGDEAGLVGLLVLLVIHMVVGAERAKLLESLASLASTMAVRDDELRAALVHARASFDTVAREGWSALPEPVERESSLASNLYVFIELVAVAHGWTPQCRVAELRRMRARLARLLDQVHDDPGLAALLHVTIGDLSASTNEFRHASEHWQKAGELGGERIGEDTLLERQLFVMMRLDTIDRELHTKLARSGWGRDSPAWVILEALGLAKATPTDTPFVVAMREALALERGRWDLVLASNEPELVGRERHRRAFRREWAQLALGNLDHAWLEIGSIDEPEYDDDDVLLELTYHRYALLEALRVGDHDVVCEVSNDALELEFELELRDALLLGVQHLILASAWSRAVLDHVNRALSGLNKSALPSVPWLLEYYRQQPVLMAAIAGQLMSDQLGPLFHATFAGLPEQLRSDPQLHDNLEHLIDALSRTPEGPHRDLLNHIDNFTAGLADPELAGRLQKRVRELLALAQSGTQSSKPAWISVQVLPGSQAPSTQ